MRKLALVLAITAALAACGKANDTGSTASTTPSSTSSPSSYRSTSPAPSAAPSTAPSTASTGSTSPAPSTDTTVAAGSTTPSTSGRAGSTSAMGAGASGEAVYNQTCQVCHAAGVAGAPKLGDKADWGPRVAQGKDTLYQHAIAGFTGKKGAMPPKGGNTALPDADVKAAVDFMVSKAN
jgi:cytochrome c5